MAAIAVATIPTCAWLNAEPANNDAKAAPQLKHQFGVEDPAFALSAMPAQVFSSSPDGGSASMQRMYLMAIAAATRSIDPSAAYFVPDARTSVALVDALQRGVRLRIVVPGEHIDSEVVRKASRAQWGPLLANGALIAEYAPTLFHCKVMVVDSYLSSVG